MERKQVKILIVDDAPDARDLLEYILKDLPEVIITGKVGSADEAKKLILKNIPDLLLLDIQMPLKSGFDLLKELRELTIHLNVIFVTGDDEHALQAIKASAFDYLLKPVDPKEVIESVQRFQKTRIQTDVSLRMDQLIKRLSVPGKLRFHTRTGSVFMDSHEIIYCEAKGNYTQIYTGINKSELIVMQIGKLAEVLPKNDFLRSGRSLLINKSYITRTYNRNSTVELCKNNEIIKLTIPRRIMGLL